MSRRRRRANLYVAAAFTVVLSVPLPAMAAPITYTWDGGNSGNWGNPTEWNLNTNYPGWGVDDVAKFDNAAFNGGGGTITLADANGDADFTVGSITKNTTSGGRNFNLNNVSGGTGRLIFANSSGTATFTNNSGPAAFTDHINVGIRLDNNLSLTVSDTTPADQAGMTMRFTKSVTESGGARGITKGGSGTFVLRAINSYSGGTTLTGGKVLVDSAGTLGGGDVTVSAGTLEIQNVNGVIDDLADVAVADGGVISLATGVDDLIGSLTLGASPQLLPGTYGALGSGADHERSHFAGGGFLRIVAVPEPTALLCWAAPAVGLMMSRRRAARI